MPRKLPWKQGPPSAVRIESPPAPSRSPVKRRKRAERSGPVSNSDEKTRSFGSRSNEQRESSSPPPPGPPLERFMDEGLENDDRYRMVEDEFLSIAKQFTVHLHAAEYKKQEELVKSRNAQTITTISRPVVGKMPNHTKQKVRGIELAKTQRNALAGILRKKAESAEVSDDSDADGLPYIGTTLHGLMDKPRRRAASLTKVVSATAATRSASGFTKPNGQSKNVMYESPQPKNRATTIDSPLYNVSTASEGEDDLDAPFPAQRHIQTEILASSEAQSTQRHTIAAKIPKSSTTMPYSSLESPVPMPHSTNQEMEQPQNRIRTIDHTTSISKVPRLSRVEQARRVNTQHEKGEKEMKNLDVIPSFL